MENSITKGVQILRPDVFLPWYASLETIEKLFDDHKFLRQSQEYYSVKVVLPLNIDCSLSLGLRNNCLREVLIYRDSDYYEKHGLETSYIDIQSQFETIWGKSHKSSKSILDDFEDHFWYFENVTIAHTIYERFVFCEGVSIRID